MQDLLILDRASCGKKLRKLVIREISISLKGTAIECCERFWQARELGSPDLEK
jgi:hypothetical protein